MSKTYYSNKKFTGLSSFGIALDEITTDADKMDFLVRQLDSIKADTSYLTTTTAPGIFNTLKNHVTRVQTDGGKIGSIAKTIKAIVFVAKNALSNYVAASIAFGYKNAGSYLDKVYSLSGTNFDLKNDSVNTADKDLDLDTVVNLNSGFATFAAPSTFTAASYLLSMSAKTSTSTSNVQISMRDTANTSGHTIIMLREDTATNTWIGCSNSSFVYNEAPQAVPTPYTPFLGKSGRFAIGGTQVISYNGGIYSKAVNTIDFSSIPLYPAFAVGRANAIVKSSHMAEMWWIPNGSQALAHLLNTHLTM
ncbi:hypothetical protein [Acinetobacter pittii]|uniref:hypothetical protein n=1 Tax=Acinetobacter pittii TaxID=48296 RepID=UPI003260CEB3